MLIQDGQWRHGLNALDDYLANNSPYFSDQFGERNHGCSVFAAMDDFPICRDLACDLRDRKCVECELESVRECKFLVRNKAYRTIVGTLQVFRRR